LSSTVIGERKARIEAERVLWISDRTCPHKSGDWEMTANA